MNSAEYQITIKSANQKVDDYVLDCKSTWTVQRLKQHISETHVNKPNIGDQRLIYAGNLLKDTLTLKQVFFRDSLCTELTNSSKTDFTIHLVCSTQLQKASTSQHDSGSKGAKTTTQASSAARSAGSVQQRPTTSAQPIQSTPISQQSSTGINSSNNVSSPNMTQSSSGTSAHAMEVAMNLLQSDHMRQQTAIFQQLANMVAAQLVQNLANGQILDPSQTIPDTDPSNQFANIIPLLNSQLSSLQTLTTTTTTTTVATHSDSHLAASSAAARILHVGNRQPNDIIQTTEGRDATTPGVPQNEQNLTGENHANARELVINHQPNGTLLGLGAQAVPPAGIVVGPAMGPAMGPAVAQPPAQAPIVEQPAPPQAVAPDVQIIQHDVIDWVYYLIRAIILFAALYIHASLFRLIFIVFLLAVAYFFNRRTARRGVRAANVPNENRPWLRPNGAAGVAEDGGQAGAGENNARPLAGDLDVGDLRRRRGLGADDAGAVGEAPPQDNNAEGEQENGADRTQQAQLHGARRPISFLKLCYLVVTDFLASLVPE